MRPEFRILAYLVLIAVVYVFPDLTVYGVIAVIMSIFLVRLPAKRIIAGWVPITLLLLFTFLGNVVNQPGKIMASSGPLIVTEEGFLIALIKSMRLLLLIAGVKILMAGADPYNLVAGLQRLCRPAERLGIPVSEFFYLMGLTIACFPPLKDLIVRQYREQVVLRGVRTVSGRVQAVGAFLVPLFVQSITSPEEFFEQPSGDGKTI